MSSVNLHYTFQYAQPEDYRFSHDSVFLARRVFELLQRENLSSYRVLDLCAGCGIVGLDFLFHLQAAEAQLPASCDFVEVQEVYRDFFVRNSRFIHGVDLNFRSENYANLGSEKYDLILCNPPYFRLGQGALSQSAFKNRCRFFMDSDFTALLQTLSGSLSERGRAFILLRNLADHGVDVETEAREILGGRFLIENVGDIRGTALVQVRPRATFSNFE